MSETLALIEKFCEMTREAVYSERYSGRWMFGRCCPGITVNGNYINILVKLCDYLRDNGVKSASAALGPIRIDNMGMGYSLFSSFSCGSEGD